MSPRLHPVLLSALLCAGTLLVHEGRYGLGGGAHVHAAAHGYLGLVIPGVGLLLALLLAAALHRWASGGTPAATGAASRPLAWRWAVSSVALLAVFTGQEVLEGLLAAGHPGAAVILLGAGGWTALPLCALAGLAVAGLLGAVRRLDEARPPAAFLAVLPVPTALRSIGAAVRPPRPAAQVVAGPRAPPLQTV